MASDRPIFAADLVDHDSVCAGCLVGLDVQHRERRSGVDGVRRGHVERHRDRLVLLLHRVVDRRHGDLADRVTRLERGDRAEVVVVVTRMRRPADGVGHHQPARHVAGAAEDEDPRARPALVRGGGARGDADHRQHRQRLRVAHGRREQAARFERFGERAGGATGHGNFSQLQAAILPVPAARRERGGSAETASDWPTRKRGSRICRKFRCPSIRSRGAGRREICGDLPDTLGKSHAGGWTYLFHKGSKPYVERSAAAATT